MRRHGERGSGLLSSVFGVAVVSGMIGLGANVAIGLWIRSTVDSVAHDAAVRVASVPPGGDPRPGVPGVERSAVENARHLLGDYGDRVVLTFIDSGDPMFVALHVEAPGVALLPRMIGGGPVVGSIDRVIVVRREIR